MNKIGCFCGLYMMIVITLFYHNVKRKNLTYFEAGLIEFFCLIFLSTLLSILKYTGFKITEEENHEHPVFVVVYDSMSINRIFHKRKYGSALSRDLFRYHHKKRFLKGIADELMPIAWHPDRYWDWCVPEDKKSELEAWFVK